MGGGCDLGEANREQARVCRDLGRVALEEPGCRADRRDAVVALALGQGSIIGDREDRVGEGGAGS